MSLRQIRKLQKQQQLEDSEDETPQKITLPTNKPRFSFNLLAESDDSSESSSSEEEEYNKNKKQTKNKDKNTTSKQKDSDDSEWERLLNEANQDNVQSDTSTNCNFEHFLSSPYHYFKNKVFETSARYWLSPGLSTKEYLQLRLLASKQFEFTVETDPENGTDKFILNLTDFYREIDDICSSAVHSQDFELFRRLMETHPYHVGILIQASCINTISSNHQEAFTHLNLAVKILQTAIPHRFSIYKTNHLKLPNVWMPSYSGDNLLVYRLLVLYMISLERKGQWQTSLAVCKLLIAMDFPEDVSHSLLHVDMYLLNCFGDKTSISNFVYNYYEMVNNTFKLISNTDLNPSTTGTNNSSGTFTAAPNDSSDTLNQGDTNSPDSLNPGNNSFKFPPLFLFMPNFAFTLPLQLFMNQNKPVPNLLDNLDLIRDYMYDVFCLEDNEDGFTFKPKLDIKSHLELVEVLGDYAPYLFLLRALVQYPLFLLKMAERTGSTPELRACVSEQPFCSWKNVEREEQDVVDHQLVKCYTYKCGDLWSGNNNTFLCQTANLMIKLYSDDEDRVALESFHALWLAYLMDFDIPDYLENVSVTEFDLSNYSLPMELESPI